MCFPPFLAVGLLDFKIYVVLALCQKPECSAQPRIPTEYPSGAHPQSIPAVPSRQVSRQCPTAEYPCSAQPQSILSAQPQSIPAVRVSLQCPTTTYPCNAQPQSIPTAEYPCSAQLQSIPAVPNHRVSLQCPPCCAQPQSIPAMPNRRVSLQCPSAEYPCSAKPPCFPATKYPCSAQPQSLPNLPGNTTFLVQ